MPYSDNLYSANDESDTESFSDELSPTDGYFQRSSMPTNVMVPDPTQRHNISEDKVLIPTREARPNSESAPRTMSSPTLSQLYPSHANASASTSSKPPMSPVTNTPPSPISCRRVAGSESEHTPLLRAPPPAYSAADTSSPPSSPEITTAYSTFPTHQLEQGLNSQHEPESMGRPIDEPTETSPLSGSPEDGPPFPAYTRKKSSLRRILLRKTLFFALVITVIVALLTSMRHWKSPSGQEDTPPSHEIKPSPPYCSSAKFNKENVVITYDLGPDENLAVVQITHEGDDSSQASHITTNGEVRLRRLPKNSPLGPSFSIDVSVSDPELSVTKVWETSSRTLQISTPRRASLDSRGPHCISLEITVWLPENVQIGDLSIDSVSLDLRVFDDVSVNISNAAQFGSISGDIIFPSFKAPQGDDKVLKYSSFEVVGHVFNSRKIDIETVSGSITGLYSLYDHLGLFTQSGKIIVGVLPHSIDPAAPAPAELVAKTTSADINIHLPVFRSEKSKYLPPPRDYQTKVESTSGGISGSFYLGSSAGLSSTSGMISLTVQPVVQSSGHRFHWTEEESKFETRSESGSTEVNLLEPIFVSALSSEEPPKPKAPYRPIGSDDPYLLPPPIEVQEASISKLEAGKLRALRCVHGTLSGKVSLIYPHAYEGTILAQSITGAITVKGDGVKLIHAKDGWANKELYAKKGVEDVSEGSSVNIKSVTGKLEFDISDV